MGLWVVVAMAVVAAFAWAIPMVFFGHEAVDNAATLTGGSKPHEGHGSSGEAPADPIGKANDVEAQAMLSTAIRSTQAYFAENGSYQGFDASVAGQYDTSTTYTTGPATVGVVSVRGVTPTTVVMVTATKGGGVLCAAAGASGVTYGREDAQSAAQCSGGW
jgi:hypothetical protein